jgi:hypothetical protein
VIKKTEPNDTKISTHCESKAPLSLHSRDCGFFSWTIDHQLESIPKDARIRVKKLSAMLHDIFLVDIVECKCPA